ncbi:MAG TPA: hypothetical protein EYP42_00880 [Aquificales bacterium]|nr:hypothetical protein [Aquificales bacterium]
MEKAFFIKRLKELLTLAHRIGKVYFGLKTAKELVSRGYKGFVILSKDVSPRVEREVFFMRKKGYNIYKIPFDKTELASWFDKRAVGVLFLPNTRLTFKIEKLLREYEKILPPLRGLKNGEVSSLETKGIRRAVRNRLQRIKKNSEGEFRIVRKGKYQSYGRFKTNYRPNSGCSKSSSSYGAGGERGSFRPKRGKGRKERGSEKRGRAGGTHGRGEKTKGIDGAP